jgi:hypothetical protein
LQVVSRIFLERARGMNQTASTILINDSNFFLEVYQDPFNKRIRVDDYRGNTKLLLQKAEEIVHQQQAEKLIIKGRTEDFLLFSMQQSLFSEEASFLCIPIIFPSLRICAFCVITFDPTRYFSTH